MFDSFVAFFARLTPAAIAFSTPDGEVSYGGFDADIDRVAAGFSAAFNPRPDTLAAVRVSNPYAHWLCLLALCRLGVPSMTAAPEGKPTILITDKLDGAEAPYFHLSPEILKAMLESPRHPVDARRRSPDTMGRLMFSSGTTGTRKAVALSWRSIQAQALGRLSTFAGQELRVMSLVGTDTLLGFIAGILTWAGGGNLVYGPAALAALPALLPDLRPTLIALAPGQLAALLDALPPDFEPCSHLRILTSGSPLPKALAARTLQRLSSDVSILYGSTEAGGVAIGRHTVLDVSPDAVGYPYPEFDVQVVDDAGTPVPAGNDGEVRIRGDHVANAYRDDKEASAAFFRDGWFYPGDIGRLLTDGLLCIAGRKDDVMNIGGVKMLPSRLEEPALASLGVRDAAAFAIAGPDGQQRAHIAIVRTDDFDPEPLVRNLASATPGLPLPMIVYVASVPRNSMSKIERQTLAAAVVLFNEEK